MFWLGVALSKFIGTGRIETAAAEIVFLALIPFVLLWFARQDERLLLPRLREYADLQELLRPRHVLRRTRRYALGALGFSTSLTVSTSSTVLWRPAGRGATVPNCIQANTTRQG